MVRLSFKPTYLVCFINLWECENYHNTQKRQKKLCTYVNKHKHPSPNIHTYAIYIHTHFEALPHNHCRYNHILTPSIGLLWPFCSLHVLSYCSSLVTVPQQTYTSQGNKYSLPLQSAGEISCAVTVMKCKQCALHALQNDRQRKQTGSCDTL